MPAAAQDLSVWIDAIASQAQPPADVAGETTAYGLLGARVLAELDGFDLDLSGRAGQSLDGVAGGQWLQGHATARTGRRVGATALRLALTGFGLAYQEPFSYEAGGAELQPTVSVASGRTVWILAPRVTAGGWTADSLDGRLWIAGSSLAVQRALGPVDALVQVEALDVENGVTAGTFLRAGAGASLARGRWTVTGEVEAQRTPLEDELGGALSVTSALSPAVVLRLEARRYLRDPLFGTAGTTGLSAGISVRPLRLRGSTAVPVAAVGSRRDGGREVRFSLRAPGAEAVRLTGDFTGWEPMEMERHGERWTARLTLPPGLHHFGFLVDGEWAVPPDAPGLVDDGWGRRNASVVVTP